MITFKSKLGKVLLLDDKEVALNSFKNKLFPEEHVMRSASNAPVVVVKNYFLNVDGIDTYYVMKDLTDSKRNYRMVLGEEVFLKLFQIDGPVNVKLKGQDNE